MSYFFLLYQSSSSSCTVFDSISSNLDAVVWINPSANKFVFGDFNIDHKDWLTCWNWLANLMELIELMNFVIIFLSQMTSLKGLTFLLGPLTVTVTAWIFWTHFFLLTLAFVLQWFPLHWEIHSYKNKRHLPMLNQYFKRMFNRCLTNI